MVGAIMNIIPIIQYLLLLTASLCSAELLGSEVTTENSSCCITIVLNSMVHNDTKIPALGQYLIIQDQLYNKQSVYKQKNGKGHIAYNLVYGWAGYPDTPSESDDPPPVSFGDCKIERTKCPSNCTRNNLWKYYDSDLLDSRIDTSLTFSCSKHGGNSPNLVVVLVIIVLVTLAIAIVMWKQRTILKWGRSNKYIKCLEEEPQGSKNVDTESIQMPNVPPRPIDKINVDVLHPKFITLSNNTITLTAKCEGLNYTNADCIYKWNVVDINAKITTTGNNEKDLSVFNLNEGTYPYYFNIEVKDKTEGNILAEGRSQGDFHVFPEPSLTTSPDLKVIKIKNVKEGTTKLWNDSEQKIAILGSDDLKASFLFQLPKRVGTETGTEFKTIACPLSDIYVACKHYKDFDFGEKWNETNHSVTYESPNKIPGMADKIEKLKIWQRKLESQETDILLKTTSKDVKAAIFVKEGKDDSKKQVPDLIQDA